MKHWQRPQCTYLGGQMVTNQFIYKVISPKGLLEMESLSQTLLIMTCAYGRLNQFETPSSPMKRMKSYQSPLVQLHCPIHWSGQ